MSEPRFTPTRRSDLDWVRVIAFGLLILYHIELVYSPFDWHVNSQHRYAWLRTGLLATSPWRLSLLFLVSGAATRFMSDKESPGRLVVSRVRRLLPPFLFGVIFLVPPQAYLEDAKNQVVPGYFEYWVRFFTVQHPFSWPGLWRGLPINHLWFVLYIGAYTVAAAALLGLGRGVVPALQRAMERVLRGPGVVIWPTLWFVVLRVWLFPIFGQTNHLSNDWYNHAASFFAFLIGLLAARSEGVWLSLMQWRLPALLVGIAAFVALAILDPMTDTAGPFTSVGLAHAVAYGVDQGCFVAAALGYGRRYLYGRDGPVLRYLTEAVFPYYIVHQTLIVAAAFALYSLHLPFPLEALLVLAATMAGCGLTYEVVRRIPVLRPLFGLRLNARRRAAASVTPLSAALEPVDPLVEPFSDKSLAG